MDALLEADTGSAASSSIDGSEHGRHVSPSVVMYLLHWTLCYVAGDPLLEYAFAGHHIAHSKRLSRQCKAVLQATVATIVALLSVSLTTNM